MNCPELYLVALDGSGKPVAGAKLQTNVAGSTSLPKNLYADAALTAAHPNPLVADGGGVFPQFYMESGGYRFALLAPDGSQLRPPRDNIFGAGSGGGGAELDWKVKASNDDGTPGYLDAKVASTDSVVLSVDPASKKLKAELSATTQASMGKVSVADGDPAGYLAGKLKQGAGITLTPVAGASQQIEIAADFSGVVDHKVKADEFDQADYLGEKFLDSDSVVWELVVGATRAMCANVIGLGVVKHDEDDEAGYLGTKLKAGSGITLTTTTDETGTSIWINSKTNLWKPLRVVANAAAYTVKDTDGIIVIDNALADSGGVANGSPRTQITFPTASAAYVGRSVTITGSNPESGSEIPAGQNIFAQNSLIGWAPGQASGAHRGMQTRVFTCRPTGSGTITYNWVDDDFFRNVGAG